jgi:hypothetical protein
MSESVKRKTNFAPQDANLISSDDSKIVKWRSSRVAPRLGAYSGPLGFSLGALRVESSRERQASADWPTGSDEKPGSQPLWPSLNVYQQHSVTGCSKVDLFEITKPSV